MANDYRLVGPPTIDLRTFQSILTAAGSPMAGEAPGIYTAAMAHGVDPAVILAIAQHESGFGKAGIAVGRHNPFGSRYYSGTAAFGAINRGGWASFPNYTAATAYTASLLASSSYAGAGLTARTFPTRYAPSSDGNNPASYGASIVNAINRWTGAPPAAAASKARHTSPKAAPSASSTSSSKSAKAPAPTATMPARPFGGSVALWGLVGFALVALLLVALAL